MDKLFLMRRKSQAPDKFSDFVREMGAPNYMITDHAEELMSDDTSSGPFLVSSLVVRGQVKMPKAGDGGPPYVCLAQGRSTR